MPSEEEVAARRRIEEEASKVISRTRLTRKLQQQELIGGENAEEIHLRKDRVEMAKKNWSIKGTEGQSHGTEEIEQKLAEKAKREYEENLKKFNEKGKPPIDPLMEAMPLSPEVTKRFVKPTTDLPTLFGSKVSIKQPKDSQASNSTNYSEGFAKIEKVEEKVVGNNRHITTTGIDQAGRRVTKTKIILPEQVGTTKAQHQQGTSNTNESGRDVAPSSWDGTFYSLTDIRQNKVPGIDKNNREKYLSPQEFENVFHMSKEEFSKLPKWKRDNMKRDLHMF